MQISPEFKKILIIILVVVALGGVVATGVAVTRSIFSKASEVSQDSLTPAPKLAPPKTPSKTATPAAAPKPVANTPAPATPSGTTSTGVSALTTTIENGWTTYGTGLVSAVLSFSADFQNLYADFTSNSFAVVTSIDYSLTYEDAANTVRLTKGTAVPTGGIIGRKVIALGTCSGTNCTYDAGAHNFVFRMLTKTNGGLTVNLKTYSLASLPTTTVIP